MGNARVEVGRTVGADAAGIALGIGVSDGIAVGAGVTFEVIASVGMEPLSDEQAASKSDMPNAEKQTLTLQDIFMGGIIEVTITYWMMLLPWMIRTMSK